ncbi:MAG: hypothetical protein ACKOW2_05230 [Sphingobacteriaceae bacterium]
MSYRLSLLLLLAFLPFVAAAQDAARTIQELTAKMNRVKDYSVNVIIRSEIPLIKIFPVKASIYYKQKDKFRILSKGIAILPKQGFTDLSKLLNQKDSFSALLTGTETIQNTAVEVITILPADDAGDLILTKLWVDTKSDLVLKSQTTTRSNGTVSAAYSYGTQAAFGLPDKVTFTIDVKKFKIPKGLATDINRTSVVDENKPAAKTGKINISFSDYVINKGIKDEIFGK